MDRPGAFSIYYDDPEIFLPQKSRGDLATPVPPHPVLSRTIWHKIPQPVAVHLALSLIADSPWAQLPAASSA